jgi:hypothetical protein
VNLPRLFSNGDFIKLNPLNDSLLVNDVWALQSTGQIFQILDVQGDSLLLNKPLRRSYDKLPAIFKLVPRRHVHIKCINIDCVEIGTAQTSNIYLNRAADCSISGVDSYNGNFAHIDIRSSIRISVENSFFADAFSYGSGGKGYGIMLQLTSGDCFVHQNIFTHLRHAMILQSGANGNVLAYNYSTNPYWTGTSLPSNSAGDLVLHGNYVYMNLFEGNVVQNIVIDNSHGINGPYNTFYRNRAELYGIFMNAAPASYSQNFIGNQVTNTSFLMGFYTLEGRNHFEFGNTKQGRVLPTGTQEPNDSTMFAYGFNSFYKYFSAIPPIKTSNWQSKMPLIEANFRYQELNKKAVCTNIRYDESVSEPSQSKLNFVVYPNPFTDKLHLQNNSDVEAFRIAIYDVLGRLVFSEFLNGMDNNLNINMIDAGIYILRIDGKEIFEFKLLKH